MLSLEDNGGSKIHFLLNNCRLSMVVKGNGCNYYFCYSSGIQWPRLSGDGGNPTAVAIATSVVYCLEDNTAELRNSMKQLSGLR